jgi:trk system potassium uptake protein TrkA
MRILLIGAGQVGSTIVEALHEEHELTVVDLEGPRLQALANRYDVRVVTGNGASRTVLQESGIEQADLVIAGTSVDESNIVAAMLARKLAPEAKTIVRSSAIEYLQLWHERLLDVDFVVSSELEAAYAITQTIGVPAARQTDTFAEGQVQIVEFDVDPGASSEVVGKKLREANLPDDSTVAAIIRTGGPILPGGDETIEVGDRIVIIGSPIAAREWGHLMMPGGAKQVRDVVIYGAGRAGLAIAEMLLEEGIGVRLVEAQQDRARLVAEHLHDARVYNAPGLDSDFIERERIGTADAAVFAMREDSKNLYAAALAKLHGVGFTIAVVHEPVSTNVFEQAGVDVAVDPRTLTAEEIVRFAHDPRTQQVVMLEGDRYEILDITTRETSALAGRRFRDLPKTGDLIGAIVRDGKAIFPHGDDVLMAGDRAIVFTESRRVAEVERTL